MNVAVMPDGGFSHTSPKSGREAVRHAYHSTAREAHGRTRRGSPVDEAWIEFAARATREGHYEDAATQPKAALPSRKEDELQIWVKNSFAFLWLSLRKALIRSYGSRYCLSLQGRPMRSIH